MLRRLEPFEVGLHYADRHRLPKAVERELGATYHPSAQEMVGDCDVTSVRRPIGDEFQAHRVS